MLIHHLLFYSWIAIGACGPTPMNDSLADAVSAAVKPTSVLRGEVRRNIYLTIEYVSFSSRPGLLPSSFAEQRNNTD